jgi:hypothetical protein
MGTVATWTAGTTTGAVMASEFNKIANAANTVGQYSNGATVALTTTPTAIAHNTNDTQAAAGGLTHSTSSNTTRFIATAAGIYKFAVQPQATHLTTGTGDCTFWLRLNGTTPVTNSAARYRENGNLGTSVLTIIAPVQMAVNDYIEIMAVASAASEYEISFTAGSGAGATAIPATPSIITTVTALPV